MSNKTRFNIEFRGTVYVGVANLARSFGVAKSSLQNRLNRGQDLETAITELQQGVRFSGQGDKRREGTMVTCAGETYASVKALAEHFGLNPSSLRHRLDIGQSADGAIQEMLVGTRLGYSKSPIIINGVSYLSRKIAARKLGLSVSQIGSLLNGRASLSPSGEYRLPHIPKGKPLTIDGVTYPAITVAARKLGVSKTRLLRCAQRNVFDSKTIHNEQRLAELLENTGGVLYVITNKITKRRYVGISMNSAKIRFASHMVKAQKLGHAMHEDYVSYGRESFSTRVAFRAATLAELRQKEREYIVKFNTRDHRYGYNTAVGGTLNTSYSAESQIKYGGKLYKGLTHLCSVMNISPFRTRRLLNDGWSLKRAITDGVRWSQLSKSEQHAERMNKTRSVLLVRAPGVGSVSLGTACRLLGLNYSTVYEHVRSIGKTPQQALNHFLSESRLK